MNSLLPGEAAETNEWAVLLLCSQELGFHRAKLLCASGVVEFLSRFISTAVLVPLLTQGAQGAQCLLSVLLSRAKYVVVHKRKRSKNQDLLVEREVGLKGKRVESPAGDLCCWSLVWQMQVKMQLPGFALTLSSQDSDPQSPVASLGSGLPCFEKIVLVFTIELLKPFFPFASLTICKEN